MYLANTIPPGAREVPYSLVAALDERSRPWRAATSPPGGRARPARSSSTTGRPPPRARPGRPGQPRLLPRGTRRAASRPAGRVHPRRGHADDRPGRRSRPRARLPRHHRVAPPLRLGPPLPGRPGAHPPEGRGLLGPLAHDAQGVRAAWRWPSGSGATAWAGSTVAAAHAPAGPALEDARRRFARGPARGPAPGARRAPGASLGRAARSRRSVAARARRPPRGAPPTSASTSCTSASSW